MADAVRPGRGEPMPSGTKVPAMLPLVDTERARDHRTQH